MTRQEANLKIYKLVKDNAVMAAKAEELLSKILECKDQRFGQIICNYICPDYRDSDPGIPTKLIMDALFPGNPDPFYEESTVTLNRLKRK